MNTEKIKALIFVLAFATAAFYVAGKIAQDVIARREFLAWRNIWIATTIATFLSGNYFLFAAILAAICIYANSVGVASVALYFVLLLAAPIINITIGGFAGVGAFLSINNSVVLSLMLLAPIMFRQKPSSRASVAAFAGPDRLIICYVLLLVLLEFRKGEITSVARSSIQFGLNILVPYFAFSRAVTTMTEFRKVFLAYVVAVLPLSLISVVEMLKSWRLYGSVFQEWGGTEGAGYSGRNGLLRAGATSEGPIGFGFVAMVAIGCLLPLLHTIRSRRYARLALAMLIGGLFAALSKGPWLGTVVLFLVYSALGSGAVASLGRLGLAGAAVGLGLLLTPVGTQIIQMLPGAGGDAGSVEYRQRLIENSMRVVEKNFLLGSVDYLETPEMQELVTGQQMVDVVNSYISVALNSGIIGLGLFVGFFVAVLSGLWRVLNVRTVQEMEFKPYARASIAILIGILLTIATVSSIDFVPYLYWSFAGLCVALVRIGQQEGVAATRAAFARRFAA